jgi:hypothetical protein
MKEKEEYELFMDEYRKSHKRCPNCGSTSYRVTLTGYLLNMNKKEDYKDLNKVICDCGYQCTVHELIS